MPDGKLANLVKIGDTIQLEYIQMSPPTGATLTVDLTVTNTSKSSFGKHRWNWGASIWWDEVTVTVAEPIPNDITADTTAYDRYNDWDTGVRTGVDGFHYRILSITRPHSTYTYAGPFPTAGNDVNGRFYTTPALGQLDFDFLAKYEQNRTNVAASTEIDLVRQDTIASGAIGAPENGASDQTDPDMVIQQPGSESGNP